MVRKKTWIDLSIFNLCVVAFLGMVLRSKMLFSLPFIDFNDLSNAHSHFAFGGWVTLTLMFLMVYRLLPHPLNNKSIYQWILGGIVLCSWCMLLSFYFLGNGYVSAFFSFFFIFITYVFGWMIIKDSRKAGLSKTVYLLSVSSVVCLLLSSVGQLTITYLFAVKSINAIFYRDALFTYLHFQYNGFFTLAVFALLFQQLENKMTAKSAQLSYNFSVLICVSILPSLFLSYLWQSPDTFLRIVAMSGSITVLLSLVCFIIFGLSMVKIYRSASPVLRFLGLLSMGAFMLKMLLQSLTIFTSIGNAVFGARPMIIGFLHLVFLGFVSLFLLACFTREGFLNGKNKFTRVSLAVFAVGVLLNETILMSEGLGSMLVKSSYLFPWMLWIVSLWMFIGALLTGIARIKENNRTAG